MAKEFYWSDFIRELNNSVTNGQLVFDAGAGDGHWKEHFKSEVNYISMDLGVGDSSVNYSNLDIVGDLRTIPLANETVDTLICIQVLEHVPEPWTVIGEFNRIMKKGASLFLTLPHSVPIHQEPYDFYRYTKYGVQYLLQLYNFEIEFIEPQLGNTSKIVNDLRMTGNLLIEKKSFLGYTYKLFAKVLEIFFVRVDQKFELYNDTTGYFIKAIKK